MSLLRRYSLIIAVLLQYSVNALELTLIESEQIAISNSFELQDMQQTATVTQLAHALGLRDFMPQLSLTYNDSRQVKYYNEDTDSIQMGVTVTQPIYNGGKSLLQRKLSAIQLSLQGAGYAKKVEEIKDQVWQLYHQVMIQEKKLELQNELYLLSKDQIEITKKKFEFGSITEIELVESEIEVQSLEIEISTSSNTYQQLCSKFNNLLGLDLKTRLDLYPEVDPDYSGISFDFSSVDYFYNLCLEKNLDLESAKFEIQQSKAQYDIATKAFIPKISLEGSLVYSGDSYPLQTPTYSAKVHIEFPYKAMPVKSSSGISVKGDEEYSKNQSITANPLKDMSFLLDKKSARIKLNQSIEKENMLRKELLFSLKQQVLDLEQKRNTLKLNRDAFNLQKRKLLILETKYRLGEVKELDLLKGNIEYYNQEIAIWEAILELILSERSLEKTMGLDLGQLKDLRIY